MVSGDGICIRSLETLGHSCGWPYAFHVQGAQMLGGLFRRQLPGPNLGDAGRGLGICILSDRHTTARPRPPTMSLNSSAPLLCSAPQHSAATRAVW